MVPEILVPDWPAPPNVHALTTTRSGGASVAPWGTFNLGDHVGDDPFAVAENRRRLRTLLPGEPVWLRQVHGTRCIEADTVMPDAGVEADAAHTRVSGVVCAVLTADCLPLLLCDRQGQVVAAAHAGWRGLVAGVIEATVAALGVPPDEVIAWLGPAIGPAYFEVGGEVRSAFLSHTACAEVAFTPVTPGKWLCNLAVLARKRLTAIGIHHIYGGDCCTASDAARFYSYRRDGVTGRMASLIWRG